MDNRTFLECLISLTSNHMKLVRRGDNPNKETLMYISYVSCSYRLSGMFTCKFRKGAEVRLQLGDRLDTSTTSRGKTHNRVTNWTSKLGESQHRSWASEWGNPRSEDCFQMRVLPISEAVNLVRT